MSTDQHQSEVVRGQRFEFGANWALFLDVVDDHRIGQAEAALRDWLGDLAGLSFLDVGSGSGLSSLVAMRLGAARVHSFDYDPRSVACTRELKRRYFPDAENWTVEEGSALDSPYLGGLGQFDVVYSWGVLHHTGAMWHALENMAPLVAPRGRLFVAIYNDQGVLSRWWKLLKRVYNRLPGPLKLPYAVAVMGSRDAKFAAWSVVTGRPMAYVRSWSNYGEGRGRGMSRWHDLIDWIGGYPFEVATPRQVVDFYASRGFILESPMPPAHRGLGCNQFVFRRSP